MWLVVSLRRDVSMSVIFSQLSYRFNAFSPGLGFSLGLLFIIYSCYLHDYHIIRINHSPPIIQTLVSRLSDNYLKGCSLLNSI